MAAAVKPRAGGTARARALLVALCVLLPARLARPDETKWVLAANLKYLDTKYVDLVGYGELHLSDSTPEPAQYLVSQRVPIDPWPFLGFSVNYTFLDQQVRNATDTAWSWRQTQRAEFEVNPRIQLSERVQLFVRNRLESQWIEDRSGAVLRSRHRPELTYALKGRGPVTELFTADEVFYDYDVNQVVQNRFVPLGLTFRLGPKVNLRVYYMWQALSQNDGWQNNHILWTHWFINL